MAYDGIRGELPAWVPPVYRERFDDEREYLVACLGLGADQIRGCLDAHDEDGIATFPIRTGDGNPVEDFGHLSDAIAFLADLRRSILHPDRKEGLRQLGDDYAVRGYGDQQGKKKGADETNAEFLVSRTRCIDEASCI
jgi:hypothetical protein